VFRSREYLTEPEIERLRKAARKNRNPVRDELLILLAFRHALRVSELALTVEQFDLKAATAHIRRAKNGTPGIHGLQGDELRLIRQLIRENGEHSRFLFLSERKAPLSIDGAQKLIERLGEAAGLPFPIHAHMLRHSAGYALAGRGVDTRTLQARPPFAGGLCLTFDPDPRRAFRSKAGRVGDLLGVRKGKPRRPYEKGLRSIWPSLRRSPTRSFTRRRRQAHPAYLGSLSLPAITDGTGCR